MKIAFASQTGETVDWHFGEAACFHLWEIDAASAEYLGKVDVSPPGDNEDKATVRANAIAGSRVVCVVQIGASSQARVLSRKIHPVVTKVPTPVAEVIVKLQKALSENPPPWLRQAMEEPAESPSAEDPSAKAPVG